MASDSVVKLRESLDSVALLGSTLSHDLKGPILIQMKAIEMLSSGHYGNEISTPENQEILSAILDNNQFELDLVLNLINLLRYKIQDTDFDPKIIKIQPFLEDIRKELSPLAVRRQQQLLINVSFEPEVTLSADPLGLKRVIHNLLNNAILHLPEGRKIQVDVERGTDEFLFSVRDNGPGIPEEKLGTLFNQVSRISSSGLGLYISKQIVERHGGRIWVESQLNKGTNFYFTLPQTSSLGRSGKFSNLKWLSKSKPDSTTCVL
jgi:two-component system NarL family sensor kinase